MFESTLDTTALRARTGCSAAKEKIMRWYIGLVNKMSLSIWFKVNNECNFEAKCLNEIDGLLKAFDPTYGRFENLARRNIMKIARDYTKNRSTKVAKNTSLDDLSESISGVAKREHLEPIDVLANIESNFETKEIAALLAQGDQRKIVILNAWIDGLNDDSKLARLLAQQFGGKTESHRQAIKRFRSECKTTLPQIA